MHPRSRDHFRDAQSVRQCGVLNVVTTLRHRFSAGKGAFDSTGSEGSSMGTARLIGM